MRAPAEARQALLTTLRRQVASLEGLHSTEDDRPVSTGSPELDRLLPAGGLRRGTLVEYFASAVGSGAGTLALAAAREACREGRALVVLDSPAQARSANGGRFYPPAAAAWGIDLSRMIVLRPRAEADALWAFDQALRCAGVAAVWAAWDRLDIRDFRRLQLAAESGRTLGLLLRPARLRGQPTWADVQWEVSPWRSSIPSVHRGGLMRPANSSWRLVVELVRCRGGAGGQIVQLELDEQTGIWREDPDHATHSLPLFPRVAHSEAARRA
jgi:protein ImuA